MLCSFIIRIDPQQQQQQHAAETSIIVIILIMGDLVSPTIKVITTCVNLYTDFCAFQEECTTFRRSLCNVCEVLEGVQEEISRGHVSGNTRLRRPMELLQTATEEGGQVLQTCSTTRKLLAFVFSRQLMGTLNKAKADIEEAMRLLQASSVRIQVSTRQMMDSVTARLDELHNQINDSFTNKHEVADMIREAIQQRKGSHGACIAMALSDNLVQKGVVSSALDGPISSPSCSRRPTASERPR